MTDDPIEEEPMTTEVMPQKPSTVRRSPIVHASDSSKGMDPVAIVAIAASVVVVGLGMGACIHLYHTKKTDIVASL